MCFREPLRVRCVDGGLQNLGFKVSQTLAGFLRFRDWEFRVQGLRLRVSGSGCCAFGGAESWILKVLGLNL